MFMERSGCMTSSLGVKRLIALAAQKFVFDVALLARQRAQLRGSGRKAGALNCLQLEDLTSALADSGVNVVKPPYYADSVEAAAAVAPPSGSSSSSSSSSSASSNAPR